MIVAYCQLSYSLVLKCTAWMMNLWLIVVCKYCSRQACSCSIFLLLNMFALYCDPLIRVYVPADRPHKFTTFVRLMDMIAACLCDPLIVVSVPAEAICQFTITFGRSRSSLWIWIGRHCWRFVMVWWQWRCDACKKCFECCVLVILVYWGVVLCVVNSASVLTPNFHDPMLDRCIFNVRYCQFDVSDLFYMGIRG